MLDFRFKRINYTEQVRQEIFKRMISERTRVASKFRSEGDGEAAKIKGQQERELKTIQSKAYLQQQQIRGGADAKAVAIYAEAYNQSPESREFYEFLKTMETYETTLSRTHSSSPRGSRFMKQSTPTKDSRPRGRICSATSRFDFCAVLGWLDWLSGTENRKVQRFRRLACHRNP